MNLPTSSPCMSPPTGKDSQEDRRIPFQSSRGMDPPRISISLAQCPRLSQLEMSYSRLLFSQPMMMRLMMMMMMMMMMMEFFKPNVNIQTQKATHLSHEIKNDNCPLPSLIGKSKSVQGYNNSSSEPKVML